MKNLKLRPMTKLLVCAATMLMATHILCAQDTSETVSKRILFDTTVAHQKRDTSAKPAADTTAKKDTTAPKKSDDIKLILHKLAATRILTTDGLSLRFSNFSWLIMGCSKKIISDIKAMRILFLC